MAAITDKTEVGGWGTSGIMLSVDEVAELVLSAKHTHTQQTHTHTPARHTHTHTHNTGGEASYILILINFTG